MFKQGSNILHVCFDIEAFFSKSAVVVETSVFLQVVNNLDGCSIVCEPDVLSFDIGA